MKKMSLILLLSAVLVHAQKWQVIGWNDLGMHCMDGTDFSVFSILPPYNTIHAHVLLDAEPTGDHSLQVTYEAVSDPSGSINTTSADKCNFWEHASDMFGAQPSNDVGLAGAAMPGVANTPQPMEFDPVYMWYTGEGIPITPFDDAGQVNYYPMVKVVVRDTFGAELASTRVVLPVSDEMTCSACHQSGSAEAARPLLGWRWHPENEKDIKLNILRLHDEKQQNNSAYFQALENQGYNTNGLYQTVVADNTAILCARCHQSNALPVPPDPHVTTTMTQAMHAHHGQVSDPVTGLILNSSLNRDSCYRCHPGSATQCLRGAMGAAVAADGGLAIQCQSCHGDMDAVGASTRNGWFDEPSCQSCHTGTATDNNGAIRFLTVFTNGAERVAVNNRFAHPADTLYRFSKGHGGLQCSACHGSPHAIYPSVHDNDNLQNIDMQGHKGTVSDCLNCHVYQPLTFNGGPHGMHPVGNTHFATKKDGWPEDWFHGKAKEDHNLGSLNSCKHCHGADFSGTVLSLAQGDRTIVVGDGMGTKHFWKGYRIGCYTCHRGPNNDNNNPNTPPVVTSTTASTTANNPVAVPLVANEGTIRIISQPRNGTVGLSGSTATYIPFLNFTGTDTFTFAAWDGQKDSNLGTTTITVSEGACMLICESVVPSNSVSRTPLPFWAFATVSNCTDAVSYAWNFGDGQSATNALAQHAYGKNGTYPWRIMASAGGLSVTNSGLITVADIQLDTDGDGIEDDWEWAVFQSLDVADQNSDFDEDGLSDVGEYLCGSNAKDPASKLEFTDPAANVVHWTSEPNRMYRINATTSLTESAFMPIETDVASTPPENTYTDLTTSASTKFYQVELE